MAGDETMPSQVPGNGPSVNLPLRPKSESQSQSQAQGPAANQSDERNDSASVPETDAAARPPTDTTSATSSKPRVSFADAGEKTTSQQNVSTDDATQTVMVTEPYGDDAAEHARNSEAGGEVPKKKKKKKKKSGMNRPASKRGQNAPNGFEEFYVDPPVTPDEFVLEEELYHKSKPFSERIQIAIQRYSSKRKFDQNRRSLWIKYLVFGGIDSGPKMFGGGGPEVDEDMTAADIITLKAKEYVQHDIVYDELMQTQDEQHDPAFVVDFDGVARAFFSLYAPGVLDMTTAESVKTYCGVIRNWYNYLLHHNVCNEYADQIYSARRTVDLAEKELIALNEVTSLLPGSFSLACKKLYVDPALAAQEAFSWDNMGTVANLSREEAGRIFLAALASMGSDEVVDRYSEQNEDSSTKIVNRLDTALEITGISPSTKKGQDMYAHPSNHGLVPMGHITARTWWCPWAGKEDLTEEEEAELPAKRAAETRDYTFWMDDKTLAKLSVGMMFTADIRELSFGLWFIETVKLIYPSYSIYIPNELMEGWREHELLKPKSKREEQPEEQQAEDAQGQIEGEDERPPASANDVAIAGTNGVNIDGTGTNVTSGESVAANEAAATTAEQDTASTQTAQA